jgi:hypothetical protein
LCGAGEWLVEKHGTRTRRAWRKLHLSVDADTGQIVAAALTSKEVDDAVEVGRSHSYGDASFSGRKSERKSFAFRKPNYSLRVFSPGSAVEVNGSSKTVRCGKINSLNRSRLSSVGISCQHAGFAIFAPQKRGACLESGTGARIQRFQHPTGGTDLEENPQRVVIVSASRSSGLGEDLAAKMPKIAATNEIDTE